MKRRSLWSVGWLSVGLFLCSVVIRAGSPAAISRSGSPPALGQGVNVPASECLQCHSGPGTEALPKFHQECTSCHAGGADHVKEPAVTNIQKPVAADCLTCHKSNPKLMRWEFGPHARTEVICRDCHSIHAGPPTESRNVGDRMMQDTTRLCATCHKEVLAKFSLPSHHPVREGGLSCTSCHDQHGAREIGRLSKTELCLGCHQNHRGPKNFEHAPVVEDCANCHTPHGSAMRRLLEVPQPTLCLQCHSLADNRHAQGAVAGARVSGGVLRACTNCHAAIHGSSVDFYLRF